jgi:hypothetical protein
MGSTQAILRSDTILIVDVIVMWSENHLPSTSPYGGLAVIHNGVSFPAAISEPF